MNSARPPRLGLYRRRSARCFLLATLLLVACVRHQEEAPRFTNLILVVIDTLRSDHLSSYGYDRVTAPFLDRLAHEGIRLQGAAASSWTKPSVATLLTGLHPQRHQANTRADVISPELPFLPAILRGQGFSTVGYTANWFTGPSFGFDRGFDRFLQVFPPEGLRAQIYRNPESPDKPHASWATDSALELAQRLRSPFFLSVHYLDPHDPYTPPAAWGDEAGSASGFVQPGDLHPWTATEEQVSQMVDQYDAVISEVDLELQRLFEGLRLAGLLEETLLVVTSDHGEEFLDHGNLTHGKTLFEEVLQVPFVLWSAHGLEPYGSEARFHHVDFLPSALQALGLEVPEGLDGVGRWQDLTAGDLESPKESLHHLDLDSAGALAMVSPPWKLTHHKRVLAKEGEPTATNLLFHLDNDPGERVHAASEADLRDDMLRRLVARHNELASGLEQVERKVFDAKLRRDLAGLGYLAPSTPQEELERRSVPDRLRVFDSRTWGLFAGGSESTHPQGVSSDGRELAQRNARLLRRIEGMGPSTDSHWVLLRPVEATQVIVAGETSKGRGSLACELQIDGTKAELSLDEGPFERRVPLPLTRPFESVVYLDLLCTASDPVNDGSRAFTRLGIRVD